jgi:hypothetical protein
LERRRQRLREARAAARAEVVEREVAPAGTASTELVLRAKEVELRDFYRASSRARGRWRGARAQAGYSSHASQAGDRAARDARLTPAREIGGAKPAIDGGVSI